MWAAGCIGLTPHDLSPVVCLSCLSVCLLRFVQSHKNQCVTCLAAWKFASPDSAPVPVPAKVQPAAESKEDAEEGSSGLAPSSASANATPLWMHVFIPPLGIRSIRVSADINLGEAIQQLCSDAAVASAIRALEIPVAGAESKSAWKPLLMLGERVLCTVDVASQASAAKASGSSAMDQSALNSVASRAAARPRPFSFEDLDAESEDEEPEDEPDVSEEWATNLKTALREGLESEGSGDGLSSMFFHARGEAHAVLAICSPRAHPTPLQLSASSCRAVPPTAQEIGTKPATLSCTTLTTRSELQSPFECR